MIKNVMLIFLGKKILIKKRIIRYVYPLGLKVFVFIFYLGLVEDWYIS